MLMVIISEWKIKTNKQKQNTRRYRKERMEQESECNKFDIWAL